MEILSREEFEGMRPFFSQKVVHDLVIRESGGKAAGCSGVSAEMMRPVPRAVGATLSLLAEMMYLRVFARRCLGNPISRRSPGNCRVGGVLAPIPAGYKAKARKARNKTIPISIGHPVVPPPTDRSSITSSVCSPRQLIIISSVIKSSTNQASELVQKQLDPHPPVRTRNPAQSINTFLPSLNPACQKLSRPKPPMWTSMSQERLPPSSLCKKSARHSQSCANSRRSSNEHSQPTS